ncbi:MAG: sugar porter family MFS transporter, partial [Bacteroidota bacterium]
MKSKLLYISFVAALGGFLFGFDTAVISGAEESIQRLWNLNDTALGVAVAIALYGTVIGALFGGIPSNALGRKTTLIWIGILYLVSALGSALAPEIYSFMVFRFLGGLGVGASSVTAPVYISEISPAQSRGRLVALFQLNLVIGILIAYVSNYFLLGVGENAWRWMLAVEAFPALIFVVLLFGIPRSPRWLLVKRNNEAEARTVLAALSPDTVEDEIRLIRDTQQVQTSDFRTFLSGRYNWPILLAFLFAFFNQASGINAVIYYAPRIFKSTGLGESAALLSTAGIGLFNLIFTALGMYLIDRAGRRQLMYYGSVGYIITLGLIAYSYHIQYFEWMPIYFFLFVGAHAIGQGAVIWVFI